MNKDRVESIEKAIEELRQEIESMKDLNAKNFEKLYKEFKELIENNSKNIEN